MFRRLMREPCYCFYLNVVFSSFKPAIDTARTCMKRIEYAEIIIYWRTGTFSLFLSSFSYRSVFLLSPLSLSFSLSLTLSLSLSSALTFSLCSFLSLSLACSLRCREPSHSVKFVASPFNRCIASSFLITNSDFKITFNWINMESELPVSWEKSFEKMKGGRRGSRRESYVATDKKNGSPGSTCVPNISSLTHVRVEAPPRI